MVSAEASSGTGPTGTGRLIPAVTAHDLHLAMGKEATARAAAYHRLLWFVLEPGLQD
jgi:hypothetical protein